MANTNRNNQPQQLVKPGKLLTDSITPGDPKSEKRQSLFGNNVFKLTATIALFVGGFRIGYCVDPDKDKDGVSDQIEIKLGMNPLNTDSDGDGVKDSRETFRRYYGTPTPSDEVLLDDKVCLTSPDGRKEICFHPSEVLFFEITDESRYLAYDWQGKHGMCRRIWTKLGL